MKGKSLEHTDGVVTTGEVVGGVLLTGDQLFRVEELTVGTLIDSDVRIESAAFFETLSPYD